MDGAVIAMDIQAAAEIMYPDLQPGEALLRYYRDLYENLPEPIRSNLPDLGAALAELSGSRKFVFLARAANIFWRERRPNLTPLMEQREASIINGSFNSDPQFAHAFACTAFIGVALALKVGIDAINRVGSSLYAIKQELSMQNIANVQGWGECGLGYHIHRLVLMEIEKSRSKRGLHLIYVWIPGNTTWHARFAERCRDLPLGRQFGGYHHDLDTICNLMWSNRRTLVEMLPPGRDAVFHLLVPSFDTIAIDSPIIFHESLHPLVIKGDLYRGHPLVWLNPVQRRNTLILQDIGVLPDLAVETLEAGGKAFLGFWLGGAACAAAMVAGATVFPPLLLYEGYLASAFTSSCMGGMATGIGTMGKSAYHDLTRPTPRILGPPNL